LLYIFSLVTNLTSADLYQISDQIRSLSKWQYLYIYCLRENSCLWWEKSRFEAWEVRKNAVYLCKWVFFWQA